MTEPDRQTLRIVDANLNRAREALRVMEEYARLGLDDAELAGAIKEARHRLAACVPDAVAPLLAGARDILGDVGRELAADEEYQRSDAAAVARTACKRLSEALRAVEEYAKVIDPAFAVAVEGLRYRGYELERRLEHTMRARDRFADVRLYVIVTESVCHGEWLATAEAALRGGAGALQLREKGLTDREWLDRAMRLAALCREHDALSIINDRPDIAVAARADGVHVGQDDLDPRAARRIVGPGAIVGVSTHTVEQVERAAADGADYIAVGPMFETETKPRDFVAGPAVLKAAKERTALPLVAVGGITERSAAAVLEAAACTLCVCRGVVGQVDAGAAAARLLAMIDRRRGGRLSGE